MAAFVSTTPGASMKTGSALLSWASRSVRRVANRCALGTPTPPRTCTMLFVSPGPVGRIAFTAASRVELHDDTPMASTDGAISSR